MCALVPTATPTPTATSTATSTPTNTATSTFTPTATATPAPTQSAPRPPTPLLPQPGTTDEGQVVDSTGFTLQGVGTPGRLIEIRVDDVVVGRARVNARSVWRVRLLPLAIGQRSITAVTIDAKGVRSQPSAPVILTVPSSAPLDFVGAGDTAVTVSRTVGDMVSYKTRRASSERWTMHQLAGHYAAPGDYDGDGVSDIAAVEERSGKLIWNIRSSITGGRSSVDLGSRGDVIVSGCRLLSAERVSAVTFHRPTRHIRAQEIGPRGKKLSLDLPVGKGDVLGGVETWTVMG